MSDETTTQPTEEPKPEDAPAEEETSLQHSEGTDLSRQGEMSQMETPPTENPPESGEETTGS